MPLPGFALVEVAATALNVVGQRLGALSWPREWRVVAVGSDGHLNAARSEHVLEPRDRVVALAPLEASEVSRKSPDSSE